MVLRRYFFLVELRSRREKVWWSWATRSTSSATRLPLARASSAPDARPNTSPLQPVIIIYLDLSGLLEVTREVEEPLTHTHIHTYTWTYITSNIQLDGPASKLHHAWPQDRNREMQARQFVLFISRGIIFIFITTIQYYINKSPDNKRCRDSFRCT